MQIYRSGNRLKRQRVVTGCWSASPQVRRQLSMRDLCKDNIRSRTNRKVRMANSWLRCKIGADGHRAGRAHRWLMFYCCSGLLRVAHSIFTGF